MSDKKKVFRIAGGGGTIDREAVERHATQASNQKGRPANWPKASPDRPGITTSDTLTAPAPPSLDQLADSIRKHQSEMKK